MQSLVTIYKVVLEEKIFTEDKDEGHIVIAIAQMAFRTAELKR